MELVARDAFYGALTDWSAALADYRSAQLHCTVRVVPADAKKWAAARQQLDIAELKFDTPDDASCDLTRALAAAAQLSRASIAINNAARVLLDPASFASSGQTDTGDRITALKKAAAAATAAAASKQQALMRAGEYGAHAFPDLQKALLSPDRFDGEVATELFVCALRCACSANSALCTANSAECSANSAECTAKYATALAAAPDAILGIEPDSRAAAARDAAALSGYHVLQCLNEEIPGFVTGDDSKTVRASGEGAAVDVSIAHATFDVEYDLARLIDRRRATQFGPVAAMTAGLNYRIVERMRTIRAIPRFRRDGADGGADDGIDGAKMIATQPPLICPANTQLQLTVGGEARVAPPARRDRAPFAGARPRAAAHAAAVAAAAESAIRAESAWRAGAPGHPARDLRAEFDSRVRADPVPPGAPGGGELLAAVVAAFEAALYARPPSNVKDFVELACGAGAVSGYICAAYSTQLGVAYLSDARPRGRPPIAAAALTREAYQTRMLSVMTAAQEFQRHLAAAFAQQRPGVGAFASLDNSKDDVRHAALMVDYRRAAAAAQVACIALPVVPSLKLYSATLTV